jgi:hypothetical protein
LDVHLATALGERYGQWAAEASAPDEVLDEQPGAALRVPGGRNGRAAPGAASRGLAALAAAKRWRAEQPEPAARAVERAPAERWRAESSEPAAHAVGCALAERWRAESSEPAAYAVGCALAERWRAESSESAARAVERAPAEVDAPVPGREQFLAPFHPGHSD